LNSCYNPRITLVCICRDIQILFWWNWRRGCTVG